MKPLGRKNYGSIPHISSSKLGYGDRYIEKGQEAILFGKLRDKHDKIIVTEKYDGSNVGVCKVDGEIYAITRSGYKADTSPYKQHHLFNDWVEKNKETFSFLGDGERLCGEWLAQVHSIKYNIPKNKAPFIVFDLFNNKNERYCYYDFSSICYKNKLFTARLISLIPDKLIFLKAVLTIQRNKDIFYTDNPEGLVFRCERKGKVDFLAKWVRSDFEPGKHIINKDEKDLIWNIPVIV